MLYSFLFIRKAVYLNSISAIAVQQTNGKYKKQWFANRIALYLSIVFDSFFRLIFVLFHVV